MSDGVTALILFKLAFWHLSAPSVFFRIAFNVLGSHIPNVKVQSSPVFVCDHEILIS